MDDWQAEQDKLTAAYEAQFPKPTLYDVHVLCLSVLELIGPHLHRSEEIALGTGPLDDCDLAYGHLHRAVNAMRAVLPPGEAEAA